MALTFAMVFPGGITLSFAEDEVQTANGALYENKDYIVSFNSPAQDSIDGWKNESLPTGNGYTGVAILLQSLFLLA